MGRYSPTVQFAPEATTVTSPLSGGPDDTDESSGRTHESPFTEGPLPEEVWLERSMGQASATATPTARDARIGSTFATITRVSSEIGSVSTTPQAGAGSSPAQLPSVYTSLLKRNGNNNNDSIATAATAGGTPTPRGPRHSSRGPRKVSLHDNAEGGGSEHPTGSRESSGRALLSSLPSSTSHGSVRGGFHIDLTQKRGSGAGVNASIVPDTFDNAQSRIGSARVRRVSRAAFARRVSTILQAQHSTPPRASTDSTAAPPPLHPAPMPMPEPLHDDDENAAAADDGEETPAETPTTKTSSLALASFTADPSSPLSRTVSGAQEGPDASTTQRKKKGRKRRGKTGPTFDESTNYDFSKSRASFLLSQSAMLRTDEDGAQCVNDYVLVQELGQGVSGVVHLGLHEVENTIRAVKVIERSRIGASHGAVMTDSQLAEVQVLRRLRHDHMVTMHECIDDPEQDSIYLVMDYIENGSIADIATDGSCDRVSVQAVKRYARQVASALEYLHSHAVVHGDIKPDNILVQLSTGCAFLADFGVAQMFSGAVTGPVDDDQTDGSFSVRPGGERSTTTKAHESAQCSPPNALPSFPPTKTSPEDSFHCSAAGLELQTVGSSGRPPLPGRSASQRPPEDSDLQDSSDKQKSSGIEASGSLSLRSPPPDESAVTASCLEPPPLQGKKFSSIKETTSFVLGTSDRDLHPPGPSTGTTTTTLTTGSSARVSLPGLRGSQRRGREGEGEAGSPRHVSFRPPLVSPVTSTPTVTTPTVSTVSMVSKARDTTTASSVSLSSQRSSVPMGTPRGAAMTKPTSLQVLGLGGSEAGSDISTPTPTPASFSFRPGGRHGSARALGSAVNLVWHNSEAPMDITRRASQRFLTETPTDTTTSTSTTPVSRGPSQLSSARGAAMTHATTPTSGRNAASSKVGAAAVVDRLTKPATGSPLPAQPSLGVASAESAGSSTAIEASPVIPEGGSFTYLPVPSPTTSVNPSTGLAAMIPDQQDEPSASPNVESSDTHAGGACEHHHRRGLHYTAHIPPQTHLRAADAGAAIVAGGLLSPLTQGTVTGTTASGPSATTDDGTPLDVGVQVSVTSAHPDRDTSVQGSCGMASNTATVGQTSVVPVAVTPRPPFLTDIQGNTSEPAETHLASEPSTHAGHGQVDQGGEDHPRQDDDDEPVPNLTPAPVAIGTPAFWSPERFDGHPPSKESDMWALGVTLFALLFGRIPFHGGCLRSLAEAVANGLYLPEELKDADARAASSESCTALVEELDMHAPLSTEPFHVKAAPFAGVPEEEKDAALEFFKSVIVPLVSDEPESRWCAEDLVAYFTSMGTN